MPQVPYQPVPDVRPIEGGPGPLRVSTPGAAFGEGIARAVEGLGKTLEHSGDELFQRATALQQLQNETDARNADAQYTLQSADLHAKFSSLEGNNAVAALPKYKADLEDLRQQIRGSLPTDMSRKMYDSSSLGMMNRTIFNGAGHAAQQMKIANDQSIDSSINAKMTEIYNNGYYPGWENEIKDLMDAKAGIKGWDKETADKNFQIMTSTAKAHFLTGEAQRQPLKAMEDYEKEKGTLQPKDDEQVQHSLTAAGRTSISRNIAMEELANKSEDPVEVRADRVAEKAEKMMPGDSQIGWYAKNAFYTALNKENAQAQAVARQNSSIVNHAIADNEPKSKDALIGISPQVKQAWENLGAKEQKAYLSAIQTIAKGDHFETPETRQRVEELKGLADSDPAKFLNISP